MEKYVFIAEKDCDLRLDIFLAGEMNVTRSYVKTLIGKGDVFYNGKVVKSGKTVHEGDKVEVSVEEEVTTILPENIPLDIMYEDDDIAVINKSQGLIVHPASGHYSGTLVNALLFHLTKLSAINGIIRPGIVHRLDKDTSGVMVVAKNDNAHLSLSTQIASRSVEKIYLAILEGNLPHDSDEITTLIGRSLKDRKEMAVTNDGRTAITKYKVLQRFDKNCIVAFKILTGRTHQIRVHAKYLKCPVVGDATYGYAKQRFELNGQLLHAYSLSFVHPTTAQQITFCAPPPDYLIKVYTTLINESGQESIFNEKNILIQTPTF